MQSEQKTKLNVYIFVVVFFYDRFRIQGDLAKKKIYPTLWCLFRDNLLPSGTIFVGYSRSKLTVNDLRSKCDCYMQVRDGEEILYEEFWKLNEYIAGSYDQRRDFELLNQSLEQFENGPHANRLFYLALPPSVFKPVTQSIKQTCMAKK